MDSLVAALFLRCIFIAVFPSLHKKDSFYWNLAPVVLLLGFMSDIVILGKDSILMFIGFFLIEFLVVGRYLVLLFQEKYLPKKT